MTNRELLDGFNTNRNLDAHTNDKEKNKSLKAFDWIRAAKIIKENKEQIKDLNRIKRR